MMMRRFFCIIGLVLACLNVNSQQFCEEVGLVLAPTMPPCESGDYSLAFEDNFDGNTLDLTKWTLPYQGVLNDYIFEHAKCWLANTGNTPSIPISNNLQVSNGTLKITAKKETPPIEGTVVTDWTAEPAPVQTDLYDYSSAWIETKQKFGYGKYEIRCRMPSGKGFWPAFWTYSENENGTGHNEIDIFEIYGDDIDEFTCNVHRDFFSNDIVTMCPYTQNNAADFTQWHVFTCFYENDQITWQIDGNTVRVLIRVMTVGGNALYCGDGNHGYGTYLYNRSFPMSEEMQILVNMAIESGEGAPDATTTFPSTFEVDYVRFYRKGVCDNCTDHFVYQNTDDLPTVTRAEDYIQAGNNVVVKNGTDITFKAPTVKIEPGFSTETGGTFLATTEACGLFNYENTSIDFVGSNAIDGYQLIKCINPTYIIEVTGAQFYSIQIHNSIGQLVYISNGEPTSNHISLWNTTSAATGWYSVHLVMMSCSDFEVRDYNLFVTQVGCLKSAEESDLVNRSSFEDKDFLIYPNPANNKVSVFYSENSSNVHTIVISDINGKEVFIEKVENSVGANRVTVDVSQFPNGVYIVRIIGEDERIGKFIVSK